MRQDGNTSTWAALWHSGLSRCLQHRHPNPGREGHALPICFWSSFSNVSERAKEMTHARGPFIPVREPDAVPALGYSLTHTWLFWLERKQVKKSLTFDQNNCLKYT